MTWIQTMLAVPALMVTLGSAGCDAQPLDLNECSGPPPLAQDPSYTALSAGTAVVEGYTSRDGRATGRVELAARVLPSQSNGPQYLSLTSAGDQPPWVEILSFDLAALAVGDELAVSVGSNLAGVAESGPGRLRITSVTPTAVEAVFSGCVRSRNQALSVSAPSRIVRGGLNAVRE